MNEWTPRSQRLGKKNYDGPYEGVPDHLKPHLLKWLQKSLEAARNPNLAAHALALRLRVVYPMDDYVIERLVNAAAKDEDLLWDLAEGTLRADYQHYGTGEAVYEALQETLQTGGSAYKVESGNIVERVGDEAQAVYDAAVASADHTSGELREAWAKAYGRDPDPSDAWDHAIKALESVLQPVVLPKDGKATLGKIVAALSQGARKFKSSFAGPEADNSVDKLVETLCLLWPNPDRHASGQPSRKPTLQEARAVVNLAAALVQCDRDGYLVALR